MLRIMRCGWCGCFCDNEGRVFEPTKQLIAADKLVGFDEQMTACENCDASQKIPTADDTIEQERLNKIRRNFNCKLSTGSYLDT
jgi:hypothetical protein